MRPGIHLRYNVYTYERPPRHMQRTQHRGTITDTYEYDAFGNLLNSTGTTPNIYKYRGEQYDSDLGLYYLRARYYNPLTGRFMGRDPFDGDLTIPGTLHKYAYGRWPSHDFSLSQTQPCCAPFIAVSPR